MQKNYFEFKSNKLYFQKYGTGNGTKAALSNGDVFVTSVDIKIFER